MVSYLYIIGSDQPPYKVGISKNPDARLKALQTGHPYPLKIHHRIETPANRTKLLETAIHRNLKHNRQTGEWFDLPLERLLLEVEFVMIRYGEDASLKARLDQGLI